MFMFLFNPKTNNFNNSKIFGRRKLPDHSINNIFDVLLVGFIYTLSFKQSDFGLKCLVRITPKVLSLRFKANV